MTFDERSALLLDEIAENTVRDPDSSDRPLLGEILMEPKRLPDVVSKPLGMAELKTVIKPVTAQEIADALAPYFARAADDTQLIETISALRDAVEKVRYPERGQG